MYRTWRRTAATTMVVVGVLSGCSEDPGPVGPGISIPPSERVTDVAAIALTQEEAERIRDACGDATDLPEPGSPCWDAVEDVESQPGDAPADCTEEICFVVGPPRDGVVPAYLRPPDPNSPLCRGRSVCEGFPISSPLATRVIKNAPPAVTTEPQPTEPVPTEATETEIEPTDPGEPTDEPTDLPPST
jgi:hypothetical protein